MDEQSKEQIKDQVKDQGRQVAQTASEEAGRVADTVKEQAAEVKREVAAQAQEAVNRAKDQLREQTESQARQAADGLHRLGDQARALGEGRVEAAGPLGDYALQASQRIDDVANRVQERGAQGLVEDVEGFARRRPGLFLAGAAFAGFLVGRMIRGASAASAQETQEAPPGRRVPQFGDPALGDAAARAPEPQPLTSAGASVTEGGE